MKPDFAAMSRAELRAYVLQHRNDTDAIQTLIEEYALTLERDTGEDEL